MCTIIYNQDSMSSSLLHDRSTLATAAVELLQDRSAQVTAPAAAMAATACRSRPAKCLSLADGCLLQGCCPCSGTWCHIWPSIQGLPNWCFEVCWGAELGGLNLNFEADRVLEVCDMRLLCEGDSVVHSSVEEETQLPTELREGLCWFELDPPSELEATEAEFPFGHEDKCSASSLIQGCRRTSSSKILCVASIRRHCAIKSWHSVNSRRINEVFGEGQSFTFCLGGN